MSTISASTTSTTGYVVTSDTTGTLVLQTGVTPTTAVTVASNQQVTFAQPANLPNTFGFKNRIINGAMVIDQRNAGASVTPVDNGFVVDRYKFEMSQASKFTAQQNQGGVTPPAGFTNYLGITSSSAYSVGASEQFIFYQPIEGFNVADLGWGTANAQTVTLSFWVRSSLTGTFGGSLRNSAANRSYPFSYSISSANTWTAVYITIPGDTTGTWLTNNGVGVLVIFSLGTGTTRSGTAGAWSGSNFVSATGATSVVGTNGATFYITGVQLERGSTATSFDFRPYGTELALCQRYLPAWNWVSGNDNVGFGYSVSTGTSLINVAIPVTPRIAPTGVTASAMTNFVLRNGSNTGGTPTAIAINVGSSQANQSLSVTTTAGTPTIAAGQGAFLFANGTAQILFTGCEL